jgi:hypothetical protein
VKPQFLFVAFFVCLLTMSPPVWSEDWDESSTPPQELTALWQLPPEESHSDWTIKVVITETAFEGDTSTSGKEDTTVAVIYNVHKGLLAAGPRKSELFARIFQSNHFGDAHTCRIMLNALAAKAFPAMLDYMYNHKDPLDIETNSATALHFLGQYFEMKCMRLAARHFWQRDLTFQNCHTYYLHAKLFQDERVLTAIAELCAQDILRIQPSSPIVRVSDPGFWPPIFHTTKTEGRDRSLHISTLATEICKLNKNKIDVELFRALTDESVMGQIDPSCASDLLNLHDTYMYNKKSKGITSLQSRCVNALATCWREMLIDPKSEAHELLKKQQPPLLIELLSRALGEANDVIERNGIQMAKLEGKKSGIHSHSVLHTTKPKRDETLLEAAALARQRRAPKAAVQEQRQEAPGVVELNVDQMRAASSSRERAASPPQERLVSRTTAETSSAIRDQRLQNAEAVLEAAEARRRKAEFDLKTAMSLIAAETGRLKAQSDWRKAKSERRRASSSSVNSRSKLEPATD